MQNIEAKHSLKAGDHVSNGIIPYMPHMNSSGRIGEHFQQIIFFAGRIFTDFEGFLGKPMLLPLGLNRGKIVSVDIFWAKSYRLISFVGDVGMLKF
jgi:hypothetical protein